MSTATNITAEPTRRRKASRALGAAAAIIALGAGVQLTSAAWSDMAEATSVIDTGVVSLTLNNVESYPIPAATLANIAPGHVRTVPVTLKNTGSLPGNLTLAVDNAGSTAALAPALQFRILDGTTAVHTGTLAAGAKSFTAPVNLAAGASKSYTVEVSLPASAPQSLQGTSFPTSLDFTLTQSS